jgi:hypothetical protein
MVIRNAKGRWAATPEGGDDATPAFAGPEYEACVSIEQSLRAQVRKHVDWADEALGTGMEQRYGPTVASGHARAIRAEAMVRVAAMAERAAADLRRRAKVWQDGGNDGGAP